MSAGQWIAGINAVAAALEHDPDHVLEVLIEAGGRNPRLTELEQRAQQLGISVRCRRSMVSPVVCVIRARSRATLVRAAMTMPTFQH